MPEDSYDRVIKKLDNILYMLEQMEIVLTTKIEKTIKRLEEKNNVN